MLLAADRVDAIESHAQSFLSLHPDNPITQTGVRTELTHNGLRARRGTTRVDTKHALMDPIIVAGPWVVTAAVITRAVRSLRRG